VAHGLPVPVRGRWLLWQWLRWVVSLDLHVGHRVGQILQ
jgi:hypothetical protein